jgi:hypothetical protein
VLLAAARGIAAVLTVALGAESADSLVHALALIGAFAALATAHTSLLYRLSTLRGAWLQLAVYAGAMTATFVLVILAMV